MSPSLLHVAIYRHLQAKAELDRMLSEEELRDALLLIFANKQDLPKALSVPKLTEVGLMVWCQLGGAVEAYFAPLCYHSRISPSRFHFSSRTGARLAHDELAEVEHSALLRHDGRRPV